MNVVVGGGWAGIAAAVELARHGEPVTLIEASDRLGGRARRVSYRGRDIDNGQHLVIGAYRELLALLRVIGVREDDVFERRPLELSLRAPGEPDILLRPPGLPAPLHLAAGLLRATGLGAGDKWRALRLCLRLRSPGAGGDRSVQALLEDAGQSPLLIRRLWEPLCLATLNAPAAVASAEIFTRVLRDAFAFRRDDSDFLIARTDLGAMLPDPARAYLAARGATLVLGRRVTALRAADGRITGIDLAGGDTLKVAQLVVALPATACLRLVRPLPGLESIAGRLARMATAPICTAYMQYPRETALPFPLVGLHGSLAQWVCDMGSTGMAGWMSVVISGTGDHMAVPRRQLIERIAAELAAFFPGWPAPLDGFLLRERHATFLSTVGVNALRVPPATPYPNLHLAGDAIATGYPSTLEGAVRSGLAGARRVLGIHDRADLSPGHDSWKRSSRPAATAPPRPS